MKPSNILLCVLFGEGIFWLLFWRHNIRVGVVGRCYIYICDHTYGMGYRKFWWLCNMHCHQMTKAKWSNHTHIALEKRSYFWFATLYAQHYMLVSINNPREKKINKSYVLVLNDDIVAGTPLQWTDGGWKINIWWNWKVWTIFVFSGEVRVPALAEGWEGGGGGEGPQPPPNQASHQQVTKSYFSSHPALDSRPKVPPTP